MAAGEAADTIDITGTESDLATPSPDLLALDAGALHAWLKAAEAARDAVVRAMTEETMVTPRPSVWRQRTPQWVLEKAVAHVWEHGATIFIYYIVHFADRLRERQAQQ